MRNIDDLKLDQVVDYDFKVGSDGNQLILYYFPNKEKRETWSIAEPGAETLDEDQLPAEILALHSCGMLIANSQRKFSYDLS
jgi:hypothetical protein